MTNLRLVNLSIHPRVVNGRTQWPKSNTARNPFVETKQRLIASFTAHLARHPRDEASRRRLEKLKP